MTYTAYIKAWHKPTNKQVEMKFVLPDFDPNHATDEEVTLWLCQVYDLSALDIYEVELSQLTQPMWVPPGPGMTPRLR